MGGDPGEITVWLKPSEGVWQALGTGLYRGITPEAFKAKANEWGSDSCSFNLRRDPTIPHPDLAAYTPCEVEIGGVPVWKGDVRETPSQEGAEPVITIQGRGRPYHLDDDKYERVYVHNRLADWKDARSFLEQDITSGGCIAAGRVDSGDGIIVVGFNKDTILPATFAKAGVVLDLGPQSKAARVVVEWESSLNDGVNSNLIVAGLDTPNATTFGSPGYDTKRIAAENNTGLQNARGITFNTPRRYVALFAENAGAARTLGADVYFRITAIRVFGSAAYAGGTIVFDGDASFGAGTGGGESVLRSSAIVKDARDAATLLLSADDSEIPDTTFDIPVFALDGFKTPREVIDAANALEDRETKVALDDRLCFRPRATTAVYEIGPWPGATFQDASLNSGDELYNRVVVTGTGPAAQRIVAVRVAGEADDARTIATTQAPGNPSFATDTATWTASGGSTITRQVLSGTPWGQWVVSGVGQTLSESFSGTFKKGVTYRLSLILREPGGSAPLIVANLAFGLVGTDHATMSIDEDVGSGGQRTYTLAWTPHADRTGVTLKIAGSSLYVRALALSEVVDTLIDRAHSVRTQELPIRSPLTDALARRLGDMWLARHRTTPMKGTVSVTGQGGVRRVLGGEPVHPAWLLRDTGQLLRLNDRVDPDNGGIGRDGRIAAVDYDHDTLTASISIDNDRRSFDALLERLQAVLGGA